MSALKQTHLRIGAIASVATALVAVVASAVAWSAADADQPAGPLWSADMTVVEYTTVSLGATSAELFANVGGSRDLQIKSLWSYTAGRDLYLEFEDGIEDAADYTLQVGELSLTFPADSSGDSAFEWNDVDVEWQAGQVLSVRIVLTSEIAALPDNAPTITIAQAVESEPEPQLLVGNLTVGVDGTAGIQRTLNTARSGFAQAFTTGAQSGGYTLSSVGMQISHFYDGATPASHLQVTIHESASDGQPAAALCTLGHPSSFSAPGVHSFAAPTGDSACPLLAADTTYVVVIEWLYPSAGSSFALIPQTYATEESAASDEDEESAEGWLIGDRSHYLSVSQSVRTWTRYEETASFKIAVTGIAVEVEEEPEEDGALWSATMTAEVRGRYSGYSQWANPQVGALSDTEFGLDDATHPVRFVLLVDDKLNFGTSELSSDFELSVDDRTFASTDAETIRAGASYFYLWPQGDLSWSDGQRVELRLVLVEAEPAAVEAEVEQPEAVEEEQVEDEEESEETVEDPGLTASVHELPASHDGASVFTFELHFSEEFDLSFSVLRDQAFTVTGGTVTRATRKQPGQNIKRIIHIQPDGDDPVTVVLPVTTDCNATGAICNGERMQSSRIEFTIDGPAAEPLNEVGLMQ